MLAKRKTIAIFGSSEPREGDSLYTMALELGRLLASKGFNICTGGYGGVMEAACRGALEEGGETIGVTVEMFSSRTPNRYLSDHYHENDLYQRMKRLIELSDGFIILHGKSGTISELAFLWALHRGGKLNDKPIVLLGRFWRSFLNNLKELHLIEQEQLLATSIALTPVQALEEIAKRF